MTRLAWMFMAVAAAAAATSAGCTRPAPREPRAPSALVRAEIAAAETAERARQHDVARTHYEQAIAQAADPSSIAFARREYAETLITWGEYPAAIAQLEGALAATPDDAGAWHDLGLLRHHQGDDDDAIAALERARALAPTDLRPRRTLAALRWQRGDRAGALAEYEAMLELDLPGRVREKVKWAIDQLRSPANGPRR